MLKKLTLLVLLFISVNVFAEQHARIIKISDGDTFIVKDENNKKVKLRLIWIDTPEKFASKKLKKDIAKCGVKGKRIIKLGKLATSYAKRYFKSSKNIKVDYYGKGYYGRSLAVVYKKNADIPYNFDIIKDGYACIYKKKRYPKILDKYLKEAKTNRRGLWGIDYEVMECLCSKN